MNKYFLYAQLQHAFIFLVFLLFFSTKIDAQTCPDCTQLDMDSLQITTNKYLGVSVTNPSVPSTYNLIGDNEFADYWPGEFLASGKNWYPIREKKETLIGTLKSFDISSHGDENDWNIMILPDEGFESFIADALPYKSSNWYGHDDWYLTSDGKPMIETEVTPVKNALNNPWFNNITNHTYLKNKRIGVYGPFVYEEAHGSRPEIHPCEQIWWKENENTTVILLIADASNRFDEMSDYQKPDNVVAGYQPWTSDKKQEAEISIPFEIDPNQGSLSYTLNSLYDHEFYSLASYPDEQSGTRHTFRYRGLDVVTVMESQDVEKYVGVTFRNICFNKRKGTLQGYIVLKTAIGNGGGGREGFVALQIDKAQYGLNEKPGIKLGDIIHDSDNWTIFNPLYDDKIAFSDIISSDKYGKGIVDGMIDFNGNGKTDLFAIKGNRWMVLYDGIGQWQQINEAGDALKDLRFGDINGDGITDILHVNSQNKVAVSMKGTQRWQELTDAGDQTNDIRVGDFNGDNKTDIVYMKFMYYLNNFSIPYAGYFNMYVKYSAVGTWQELSTGYHLFPQDSHNVTSSIIDDYHNNFRFGNFNGDNITDIFRYYENKFMVYWNGRGDMQELCQPLASDYNANDFLFVDNLSKTGFTDVIYVKKSTHAWKIFYGGKNLSAGRILKYNDPELVHFGNLDNDTLWEPLVIDAVKQPGLPTDIVFTPVPKVAMESYVLPKYEKGSIKRMVFDGKPVLTMNMNLQYHASPNGASRKREDFQNISAVKEKDKGKVLRFTQITNAGEEQIVGRIADIPLSAKENKIEVKFSADPNLRNYDIHPYSIGAVPHNITESAMGPGTWDSWKSFLSPIIKSQYLSLLATSPGLVEKVTAIQFELFPFYSSLEDGRVSIAEMDEMTKELNEIAYGTNGSKIENIFGDTSVFNIKWKYELKNIQTGAILQLSDSVPISSNGKWVNSKINYTFPPGNELLQLKATATIEDKLGNRTLEAPEFVFYNQRVKLNQPENQLGIWLEKIRVNSAESFKYLVLRANHMAKDTFLTPAEIGSLLK